MTCATWYLLRVAAMVMYPIKLSFMIQVLLVFTCEIQSSKARNESQRNLLRDSFQKELMDNSENLLTLQQIFLTPRQKNPNGLYLDVEVIVEGRVTDNSYWLYYNIDEYCDTYSGPPKNSCVHSTSIKFEILPPIHSIDKDSVQFFLSMYNIQMILQVLDPSFRNLVMFQSLQSLHYPSDAADLHIYMHVDKFEIKINELEADIRNALYLTLSWAKAYAKSDGNQTNFTILEDISWLMEMQYDDVFNEFPSLFLVTVLIFFIFLWLNILLLIFTVLNIDKAYPWLEEQRKSWKDMYKASAGVLIFVNLAAFSSDLFCVSVIETAAVYDKTTFFSFLTIKLVAVVMIITLELLVSCHSTLKHNKKRLHGILHALALCQIIWFGHRVATDAIISIIAFIIAPAQTLGTATLLLSTVACMILFVSSLLKQRCQCCSKSDSVFCTVLIGICTIGLTISVTFFFTSLVDRGLKSAGIGGFILSIVPPMTIFVIGLCIDRDIIRHKFNVKFFANEEVSRAIDDAPINEIITDSQRQVNETTPLIQNN